MKAFLCTCNNCNGVFIDPNPGTHLIELEVPENTIELEQIQDDGEATFYYACPNCKTDGYLMDIEKVLN